MSAQNFQKHIWRVLAAGLTVALVVPAAHAQVPPDIAAKLRETGQVVDPAGTALLYRPLQPRQPVRGRDRRARSVLWV